MGKCIHFQWMRQKRMFSLTNSHQLELGILLPMFQLMPMLTVKMDTEIFTVYMACLFLHQGANIYCEKNVHMIDMKCLSLREVMDFGGFLYSLDTCNSTTVDFVLRPFSIVLHLPI